MTKLNLNFKLFFLTKIIVIFIIICTKSYADTSIEKSIERSFERYDRSFRV